MALVGVGLGIAHAAVGITLSFPSLWVWGLFGGGYVLQFLGHAVEGNDPGEIIVVKRLLGRPYVAVAPRRLSRSIVPSPDL